MKILSLNRILLASSLVSLPFVNGCSPRSMGGTYVGNSTNLPGYEVSLTVSREYTFENLRDDKYTFKIRSRKDDTNSFITARGHGPRPVVISVIQPRALLPGDPLGDVVTPNVLAKMVEELREKAFRANGIISEN